MKKLLYVLSLAAIGTTSILWAEQADMDRYDYIDKPALTQQVAQKDQSAAAKAAEQRQLLKVADDPPSLPLSRKEAEDTWDPRCIEAIC